MSIAGRIQHGAGQAWNRTTQFFSDHRYAKYALLAITVSAVADPAIKLFTVAKENVPWGQMGIAFLATGGQGALFDPNFSIHDLLR